MSDRAVLAKLTEQFCLAVTTAAQAPTDFPAFLFRPFSAALTARMIARLPPPDAYRPLPHPDATVDHNPTRFAMPLNQGGEAPPFWRSVAQSLRSDPVRQAVANALDLPAAAMHPAVALIRDLPGYRIRIHPDSRHKLATVQIYLASHADAPHIGARLYRKHGPDFTETAAVPYLPGSGYFFRRTDNSWHGVDATTETDGVRDSLMLIYFDSPKNGFS